MNDLDAVRFAVHERNISRYRWLLRTKLNNVERDYVERRLAEEQRALALLMQTRQPQVQPQQMRQQRIQHRRERRPRAAASTVIAAASLAGRNRGSSHSTE